MPKLLVQRFAPDSINQFRIAAQMRNAEAWSLFRSRRGTAAVYLWGYAAEMTLKAAWFSLVGFPDRASIPRKELNAAKAKARDYGILWRSFHDVAGWSELLARHRMDRGPSYPDCRFAAQMVMHGHRISDRWKEDMRYKKNVAYLFEVATMAESVTWLLRNSHSL